MFFKIQKSSSRSTNWPISMTVYLMDGRALVEQLEQWTAKSRFIFLFPSSRASRSCRAPREISRSPRLAHKAPVMQANTSIVQFFQSKIKRVRRLFNKTICIYEHFDHLDHFILQYHSLGKTNQRCWISATIDITFPKKTWQLFITLLQKFERAFSENIPYFTVVFFFSKSTLSWHSCMYGLKLHSSFAKHATIVPYFLKCYFV